MPKAIRSAAGLLFPTSAFAIAPWNSRWACAGNTNAAVSAPIAKRYFNDFIILRGSNLLLLPNKQTSGQNAGKTFRRNSDETVNTWRVCIYDNHKFLRPLLGQFSQTSEL